MVKVSSYRICSCSMYLKVIGLVDKIMVVL